MVDPIALPTLKEWPSLSMHKWIDIYISYLLCICILGIMIENYLPKQAVFCEISESCEIIRHLSVACHVFFFFQISGEIDLEIFRVCR